MVPLLNHLELAELANLLQKECVGAHVDRLIIPERPEFPDGYLKSEWVLRLEQKRRDLALFMSLRPRACSLGLLEGKGPKHANQSTRSPFDQALSKHLKGARLVGLRALAQERMLVLEFSRVWLILVLIPALPEAFLVDAETQAVIARSRTIRDSSKQISQWRAPEPRTPPAGLLVRSELLTDAFAYQRTLEQAFRGEAFQARLERVRRAIKEGVKFSEARKHQADEAMAQAEQEPDWRLYGETLKAWLYDLPETQEGFWILEGIRVPAAARSGATGALTPPQLVERFFQLAKRKKRRREEALLRRQSACERLEAIARLPEIDEGNWAQLRQTEAILGLAGQHSSERARQSESGLKVGVPSSWQGKVFVSKEGFPILVGRSRDENLELTFKIARGNDLWMHVRGRPGAHVVIPVPSGKSVPLETLLDAAALCIFWSGGKNWGKTEVDYTFKKYVKRIKDSTEASYTNNKTLIAIPDEARLARLSE
ncbi:MAG: hypothetical protein RJB38_986 [Pseudomonadota bacterium]|jgi:predicted ribosome quality control (RQC) complex YloA/Tae2 family protein